MKETINVPRYTDSLVYAVKLTDKYTKMLGLQLFANLGLEISPEELIILDIVNDNPNICQRELAKLLVKDRANTGRLLESLEKKNLMERVVDVKNNRLIKRIALTSLGKETYESVMSKVIPVFNRVYDDFTEEEVEITKNALAKLRNNLKTLVDLQI